MELEIRLIDRADAEMVAAAFAAIGWANKTVGQYVRYAELTADGTRPCWLAFADGEFAGYVTLNWAPDYLGIAGTGVPDIEDLNVLPQFRQRGIASALLERAEEEAATRSPVVAIGVGLHPGYNAAQVLYVKRGFVPDGLGVEYANRYVQEGETVRFDDSLALHFTKQLR